MYKRSLSLGLVSGVLSGLASVIYQRAYHAALGADFSNIIAVAAIFMSSIIGCCLAALGYVWFSKWFKSNANRAFNLVFVAFCLLTLISPFAFKLPLSQSTPELFPGMVVPMHLFPALAWLTLHPFFFKDGQAA